MSTMDRPSNVILDSLNRIYHGKQTGGLSDKELSDEIIRIGDLVANSVRNGKLDTIEILNDIKGHVPDKNYFKFQHKDLELASKTFDESIEMAYSEREERFQKGKIKAHN